MCRYIESARFHVKQWLSCPSQHATVSSKLAHGMGVYANRQAYIHTQQAQIAAKMWNLSSDTFFWKAGPVAKLLSSVDVPTSVYVSFRPCRTIMHLIFRQPTLLPFFVQPDYVHCFIIDVLPHASACYCET